MIVCTRCGFQNEDTDTFCGSCAGFLEWSGEKVAAKEPEAEPEPQPTPEPEAEADRAGFIDRVKDRMGIGDGKPGEAAAGAGAAEVADRGHGGGAPGGGGATPVEAPVTASAPEPAPTGSGPAAPREPVPAAAAASPAAGPVATPAPVASVAPVTAPPPPPAPAAPATPVAAAASGAAVAATLTTADRAPAAAPPAGPPAAAAPPAVTREMPAAGTATAPVAPSPVQPSPMQPSPVQPSPVQPSPVQPNAVQPEAVKPAAAKARPAPRAKAAPTARVVNPGDLVCGQCGEGNDPTRKFCRRCGASLQRATIFVLPWYQRWWRKLTTRKTRAAGDRPRSRRRAIGGAGPGWLTSGAFKVLGIAIVLGVLLTIVGPWRDNLRHDVSHDYHRILGDVHPKFNPVHPFAATATSAARLHPAANAIDGAVNTSWQTNTTPVKVKIAGKTRTTTTTNGVGQSLSIRLAAPSNLDEIGFLNGDQDTPSAYLTEPRPERVHVTAAGAHPYIKDLTLKDSASFQTFTIKAKDASSLTITIDSVYPSDQGNDAAIAEVELFVKA